MATELRITFDGSTPGLAAHRLSMSLFAEALSLLASALQRTASATVSNADTPKTRGAIAEHAKLLDLELVAVEHNCFSLHFDCVTRETFGPQFEAGEDLAAAAAARLMEDIEAECSGKEQSPVARRYLQALPEGLIAQKYLLTRNGQVLREFSAGAVPELAKRTHSRLVQVRGQIVTVGFPPGTTFVAIKTGEKRLNLSIEGGQIDGVLRLRGKLVRAAVLVSSSESRLIWIRPEDDERNLRTPSSEEIHGALMRDWKPTLDLLAQ